VERRLFLALEAVIFGVDITGPYILLGKMRFEEFPAMREQVGTG
jgi:hypothetical protein